MGYFTHFVGTFGSVYGTIDTERMFCEKVIMSLENFIGISREIRDHWIYKDAEHFKVWFEMLWCARFIKEPKTDTYEGVLYTLNYAEFLFGYPSWSRRLGIGEQRLRTLVKKLIKENMIVLIKKHTKFTIYFIVNYEKFNKQTNNQQDQQTSGIDGNANKQNDKQLTSSQQADNKQITTKEECKRKSISKSHSDSGKTPSEYKEIIAYFYQMYEQTYNTKYMFNKSRDGDAAKKLLSTYGLSGAKEMVDIYFDYTDDYISENGRSIYLLGSSITINKLVAHKKRMEYYK